MFDRYAVEIGACPPTSTRPSGSNIPVLWYVRGRVAVATGDHVFLTGSYSSACLTGRPRLGACTSSMSAPENAITWPLGNRTPLGYQRAFCNGPVDSLESVSLPVGPMLTVSMRLAFDPSGVPGDGATALGVPPASGSSGSIVENVDPRNPNPGSGLPVVTPGTPRSAQRLAVGSKLAARFQNASSYA